MSTKRNRRVAMDFLVTAGRGDMEAFLATITNDVEFQTMGCSIVSAKRTVAKATLASQVQSDQCIRSTFLKARACPASWVTTKSPFAT